MFEVFCSSHGTRVLLTARHIERFLNGPDGVTVEWRCWCGTRGHRHMGTSPPDAGVGPAA